MAATRGRLHYTPLCPPDTAQDAPHHSSDHDGDSRDGFPFTGELGATPRAARRVTDAGGGGATGATGSSGQRRSRLRQRLQTGTSGHCSRATSQAPARVSGHARTCTATNVHTHLHGDRCTHAHPHTRARTHAHRTNTDTDTDTDTNTDSSTRAPGTNTHRHPPVRAQREKEGRAEEREEEKGGDVRGKEGKEGATHLRPSTAAPTAGWRRRRRRRIRPLETPSGRSEEGTLPPRPRPQTPSTH